MDKKFFSNIWGGKEVDYCEVDEEGNISNSFFFFSFLFDERSKIYIF